MNEITHIGRCTSHYHTIESASHGVRIGMRELASGTAEGDTMTYFIHPVTMLNSAGVFQLDALLKEKLSGLGLEPYVEIVATIEGETEKKQIEMFWV